MIINIGKSYDLNELSDIDPLSKMSRDDIKILCIDDQGFPYEEIIRNHGFSIRVIHDIDDIKAVAEYPVIICDIKGIGSKLGSKYEGGHVIEEIKKNYPEKFVIAFTGQQFDATYNRFFSMSDVVLTKDIDSDEWVQTLDGLITKIVSPVEQWKRIRTFLYDKDVSTRLIYELELSYIESVKNHNKMKFENNKLLKTLKPDVRSVVNGFISSAIFTLITG